jgi:hypothetical protein
MNLLPNILAAGDDEIGRIIVPIVVAIVWGIGALINAAKKKQKEAEERRKHSENWSRIEQEMRQRAAQAQNVLAQPPPLPYQVPQPYQPPPPPPPVFAPTRSIEGPYVPPRPVPPRAVMVPPVPQSVSRPPPRKVKKKGARPAPPVPAEEPAVPHMAPSPPASVQAVRPAPAGADATALSRWLTAKTLRSQFILTEILQPPLALREPREP